jgi:hypothetical protein
MCRAAFTDTEGMTHSVKVRAGSVREASALGLAEFKRCSMDDAEPGPGNPVYRHCGGSRHGASSRDAKPKAWLEGSGRSPAEHTLKARLREMLARQGPKRPVERRWSLYLVFVFATQQELAPSLEAKP